MKKNNLWLGVLAIVLVFTMTACGGNDSNDDTTPNGPAYTPITKIPNNYLNTSWNLSSYASITFGSDASKFSFRQTGFDAITITNFSPCTKDEIAKGFDSALNPSGKTIVSFMNDGSKLHFANSGSWVKKR